MVGCVQHLSCSTVLDVGVTGAPEDRWDPFDPERPLHCPPPIACPSWADPSDIAYAIAEFQRSGFRRPLHSYRALHSFAALSKAFAGMTIDQPSFFLMSGADRLNGVREIREAELRRVRPGCGNS